MHVRLFAAAQHLERVAPDALHGGNVHPLAAGVDLRQVRAEGHAVEPRQLPGKQSALDAGVDGFHLRIAAVLFAEDRDHALAQRRVLAVFPRGVVARDGHRAAELRHQAAQACDEHLLLRGHAAAHAERRLHGVRIRRQDAEIQRRLHETRNVPAHGLNAVRQAAEHAHGALRGRLVHRRLLRLGCVNAHGHIRVGGRVFVPERGVHVRDRRLRGGCIGHGDDGPALARDGVILQAAGDGDEPQRRARADGVQHAAHEEVCVAAALVDLCARVAAEQTADRHGQRCAGKRRARDRQRAHGHVAAGAADGEHALVLGVEVEHRAPLQHGGVQCGRAEHAGLLIDGDDDLERGVGDVVRSQDRQRHGHGDGVVPAERCAACADRIAVHEEVEPLAGHVLRAVRRSLADHVHVPLQDDRGGGFIPRRAGCEDDDIVVRVLNAAQLMFGCEANKVIADGFCVAGAVWDGAQLLKTGKDSARLQMIENRHDKSPLLVKWTRRTRCCARRGWLRFGRDLHPGQGGADVAGEQQTQAADLRLEILFHPVFEPFVENVRDAEAVEVAHELFVRLAHAQAVGLCLHIAAHHFPGNAVHMLFQLQTVRGGVDVVHGALVLTREAGGGDHALFPTAGRLKFIERALGLAAQDGIEQLIQVGVMIIKRPACDLAFFHELRYGDLVKRLLGQQLQERILDGGFSQMCQAGSHLSGRAARSLRGRLCVLCGEIFDVRIAVPPGDSIAHECIDFLMQGPAGAARRQGCVRVDRLADNDGDARRQKPQQLPLPVDDHHADGGHLLAHRIGKRCVRERADTIIIWPDVRLRVDHDGLAALEPPVDRGQKLPRAVDRVGQRDGPEHLHDVAHTRNGDCVRRGDDVCAARERQQRRDEGIRQRVRVVTVEKIAAGQLAQRFAVFDPQAENELAVQKQKRRHDQPVDDERERLPDRAGVLIRKVGADRLRPDVPVRRREVVVQRVVIIDGLAAHAGSPRRATASKSICSIWRMQLCCSNCVPLSRYFRL